MNYHHLTIEERCCLREYYQKGYSYRKIAKLMGRNVSTISRELNRNFTHMYDIPTYYPHTAQKKYKLRRSFCHRGLFQDPKKLEYIKATPVASSARLADLVRRPQISYADIAPFDASRPDLPLAVQQEVEIQLKYAGYLDKQLKQVAEFKKEEARLLPPDIDYLSIAGLRLEAQEKLQQIRPMSIGQAGRISGVSPADIAVLLIWREIGRAHV